MRVRGSKVRGSEGQRGRGSEGQRVRGSEGQRGRGQKVRRFEGAKVRGLGGRFGGRPLTHTPHPHPTALARAERGSTHAAHPYSAPTPSTHTPHPGLTQTPPSHTLHPWPTHTHLSGEEVADEGGGVGGRHRAHVDGLVRTGMRGLG